MRTYHIGFIKSKETLIVQMVRSKDSLSCQLWKYFGQRENTKKALRANKMNLLNEVNKVYGTAFSKIQVL
jgi:hypothetical protein